MVSLFTLSSPSNLRVAFPRSPTASPSLLALSVRRKLCSFPEFTGLKIHLPSKHVLASLNSRSSWVSRRGGRIVCEAQDTALDVKMTPSLGFKNAVPTVTDATWQTLVLKADGPVLVEFWAPWCGPCRMIHPIIGEVSKEYAGKLKCFKLNTDDSPSTATEYGIRSIPTIMIFCNGEKKDSVIGAVPKTTLTASIEKFL